MASGNFNQAVQTYTQALSFDPNNADTLADLSDAYLGEDDFADAIAALKNSLNLNTKQMRHHAFPCRPTASRKTWYPSIVAGSAAIHFFRPSISIKGLQRGSS